MLGFFFGFLFGWFFPRYLITGILNISNAFAKSLVCLPVFLSFNIVKLFKYLHGRLWHLVQILNLSSSSFTRGFLVSSSWHSVRYLLPLAIFFPSQLIICFYTGRFWIIPSHSIKPREERRDSVGTAQRNPPDGIFPAVLLLPQLGLSAGWELIWIQGRAGSCRVGSSPAFVWDAGRWLRAGSVSAHPAGAAAWACSDTALRESASDGDTSLPGLKLFRCLCHDVIPCNFLFFYCPKDAELSFWVAPGRINTLIIFGENCRRIWCCKKGAGAGSAHALLFFVWKVKGDAEIKVFRIAAFITQEIFVQLLSWIAAFASCLAERFSALLEGHN